MFFWINFCIFSLCVYSCKGEMLPEPRLVIIGQTGAGKSTLANVLLGNPVECQNCTFPVCDGLDSCTKKTKYAVGHWLTDGASFTIVDTPGFGDSDNDDVALTHEMMDVLENVIEGCNGIVLLINGEEKRFDASLQHMMREMQDIFSDEFWKYTIIGVSHWAYDKQSVMERNNTKRTEDNFIEEWNQSLREKFQVNVTLSGVFIDSWSQQSWNINDEDQQAVFQRETSKLWEFATNNNLFEFKNIGDGQSSSSSIQIEKHTASFFNLFIILFSLCISFAFRL